MQEQDRPNNTACIWDLRYLLQKISPVMSWMLRWEVISWSIPHFLLLISVWPSETVCRVPALHPGKGCCCSAAESARLGQQLCPVGQTEEQGQRETPPFLPAASAPIPLLHTTVPSSLSKCASSTQGSGCAWTSGNSEQQPHTSASAICSTLKHAHQDIIS